MTSPAQSFTPTFAIPYQPPGAPMYEYRQVLENLAARLEAVLSTVAVSPPGASDLLAVSTRVSVLETDQAAEDTARAASAPTLAANFAQFTTAPYGELLRCWKNNPDTVNVSGMVMYTGTGLAVSGTAVSMFTLPAGFRPAVQLVRLAHRVVGTTGVPSAFRCNVSTAGVVQVVASEAVATNQWFQIDWQFRTVNT